MSATSRQNLVKDGDGFDYVTIDPQTATTPPTDAGIYFSPPSSNQPNQPGPPPDNDGIEYLVLDPLPSPSTSDDNVNLPPTAPNDASPQKPPDIGPGMAERLQSGEYNLPGTNETYDLNTKQGGLYDLAGDSGGVYRVSNTKAKRQTEETCGWFTRTKKAVLLVIILIIVVTAASIAVYFKFFGNGK